MTLVVLSELYPSKEVLGAACIGGGCDAGDVGRSRRAAGHAALKIRGPGWIRTGERATSLALGADQGSASGLVTTRPAIKQCNRASSRGFGATCARDDRKCSVGVVVALRNSLR